MARSSPLHPTTRRLHLRRFRHTGRSQARTPDTPRSLFQVERLSRVLLHDERPYVWPDLQLTEACDQAVWRQDGIVRAEKHLALQHEVGRTNQRGWDVLRQPARQGDLDVRLVLSDRNRLVLPWHGWVGHDDGEVGQVGGDIIEISYLGFEHRSFNQRPPGRPDPMLV